MIFRRFLLTASILALAAGALPAWSADPAPQASMGTAPPAAAPASRDGEDEAVMLFLRTLREVRDHYVDPMSNRELAEIAVQAMAGRDRWSRYLSEGQYKDMQADNQGTLVGIGIRYALREGAVRVTEVFPGTPAEQAGMKLGDRMLEVDGKPLAGLDLDSVRALIRGDDGTRLRLTVEAGDARRVLVLERRAVTVPSVRSTLLSGTGYIRIAKFDRQTVPGLGDALREFRRQRTLRGIVIDLRDNPGGLVDSAIRAADAFLERGRIMSTRSRDGGDEQVEAQSGDDSGGLPLVLLVNSRTASAAEILAGALQDNGRARLVGGRTYGKGVIQTTRSISGGGALKLTTARYYTPLGHPVHEAGIAPDIVIGEPDAAPVGWGATPDPTTDVQLAQALSLLGQDRQAALIP